MQHSHSCWSCTLLSSVGHTVCAGIWGVLAGWSSHGVWSIFWGKLLLHLTARSTKNRWFDRSSELEFLLALSWLVSAQPKEPPWDPVQKCQNLHTKMKSNHKYYLSSKYSAFTFSPPVAADVCALQGLCFSLSGKEFEWENKKSVGFASRSNTHKEGKGAVTHKGRSISMNRVTECSFRTGIKGPLAQKQQSSNPVPVPLESQEITQEKKPKPSTLCVHLGILFQCTLQKHWSKQNFRWKKNIRIWEMRYLSI